MRKLKSDEIEVKDISGYEGLYSISKNGDVFSCSNRSNHKKQIKIKPQVMKNGYVCVYFYKDSKRKTFKVHRLVASAFLENKHKKEQVNHKNGIKTDNRVENLEWCTQSENQKHAFKNKLNKGNCGLANGKHRSVIQYSKNGELIKKWGTMTDACRELKINVSNVCNCCKGKIKSVGGFVFVYGG